MVFEKNPHIFYRGYGLSGPYGAGFFYQVVRERRCVHSERRKERTCCAKCSAPAIRVIHH